MRREATDIVSVDFAVEEGTPVKATPGAHLRLALGDRLVRQYTLCNGPDDASFYRVAVKREPASRGDRRRSMRCAPVTALFRKVLSTSSMWTGLTGTWFSLQPESGSRRS